ncbi:MAG: hypothetical protein EPO26_05550 [Chloroflexota bacterium]|nr:MAG: hypothetical protein EPO26_05550 [Chloroflexota bacterium]
MASPIAFSGLASGLNSNQLIDAMLSVDKGRVDALKAKQAQLGSRISSVGNVRSKLSTLLSKLDALRFQSQIMTRSISSSLADAVSATADSSAAVGSFKVTVDQLATTTRRDGASGVGNPSFDELGALASSGLALTPTAGRFTINGTQITVAAPTKIQDFVDAINASTASHHVVASYVLDGGGNKVGIRLDNDGTQAPGVAISVGSAGDTSNFLTAAKLDVATQAGETLASTSTLGRIVGANTLATARMSTALSQATGTFSINGVSFSWDSAVDSVNSVMAQISSSAANVNASYDGVSNRIILSSKSTGAQSISVSDTTGNLMAALGATNAAGAAETLGLNALYRVDAVAGGAQQSSTSNTITGVVPGVTLTLKQQNAATPVTVTVGSDVDKPLAAMKEFVAAFNDAFDYIRANTKPDPNGKSGILQSESGVRMIGDSLRSIALAQVGGLTGPYSTLGDLGLTFGAVGSAVGTTNKLVLDEAKFKDKLAANPSAVQDVLNSAVVGSQGIFDRMRSTINSATLPGGVLTSITDASTTTQTDIGARVKSVESRMEQRRARLEAQFARMEGAVAQLQSQAARLNAQLAKLG